MLCCGVVCGGLCYVDGVMCGGVLCYVVAWCGWWTSTDVPFYLPQYL